MKKNNKTVLTYYVIASALIWGFTIIGCALTLKDKFSEIFLLLTGAATAHLLFIWGTLPAQLKKQRAEEDAATGI